ncbi:hypothetical protein FLAG1_07748 [Fusarium langsethiae]|uniref:Alcohol acetyltransferase n=1 Tax=Fusarium langsethiae TaxID=179993 RepID=A0A0N0DDA9_FUSLA|nr:hypothetical protein FLAG1_07748 [Fusarium langsethiae]
MAEHQLPKIRPLGKLEEIAAAAHHIDFFTNCAISAHYRASQPLPSLDLEPLVLSALSQVLRQHPILFAIPVVPDTEQPYWSRLPSIDLKQVVSFVERSCPLSSDSQTDYELDALLEDRHNTSFKAGYGTLPVWRLIILQDYHSKDGFMASFCYHHSQCDGTSSQILQDSFQRALCDISSGSVGIQAVEVVPSDESSISLPLEDLHPLPLPESLPTPDAANPNEWRGSRVDNVLGNYIDAFKVQLHRSDLDQSSEGAATIWKHAKKVQQATRQYFANTSPSGEPYANVAIFKLIPDVKAFLASTVGNPRGESFEVSNLGHFPEPKILKGDGNPSWRRGKLLLSRCAFASGAPLVICVIDNEESVGIGFTWQADVGDDEVADSVIDGLKRYFTS